MIKTICDKCGKEIEINPFANASVANPNITIMQTCGFTWDKKSIDLCSDCQRAFLKWLNEPSIVTVLEELKDDIANEALPQEYIDDVTVYVQAREECVDVIQRKIDSYTEKSEDNNAG